MEPEFRVPAGRAIGAVSTFVTNPLDSIALRRLVEVVSDVPPSEDPDARVLRAALIGIGVHATEEQSELRAYFAYDASYEEGAAEIARTGHTFRDMELVETFKRKHMEYRYAAQERMHQAYLLAMGAEFNALGTSGLWDRTFNSGDETWVRMLRLDQVRRDSLKSAICEMAHKEAGRLR